MPQRFFLKNRMRDNYRDVQDHNVGQKTKSGAAAAFSNFKKDRTCWELGIKSIKQGGFPLSKKGATHRMTDEEEDSSSFSNSRLSEVEASTVNQ